MFSSLNVESARLARLGHEAEAQRVANAAAEVESSDAFAKVAGIIAELGDDDAIVRAIEGTRPDEDLAELTAAMRTVASITEKLRIQADLLAELTRWMCGYVAEVHKSFVLLVTTTYESTAVPRALAHDVGRDRAGEFLAFACDRVGPHSYFVDVMPALLVQDNGPTDGFAAFGRSRRALEITADDERLLEGEPDSLNVLVPVLIEA